MAATPLSTRAMAPENAVCGGCRYPLAGLPEDGRCPECGRSVEATLFGDPLRLSPPSCLAALHLGATLTELMLLATAVLFVGHAGVSIMLGIRTPPESPLLNFLPGLIVTAVAARGWWLLTTPDPVERAADRGQAARRVLRIATIASTATVAIYGAFKWIAAPPPTPIMISRTPFSGLTTVSVLDQFLFFLQAVASAVVFFASLAYVRRLGRRVPCAALVVRAGRLMWLGPVLWIAAILTSFLGPLIAFTLYFLLFDRLRVELVRVRRQRQYADAPLPPA